MDDATRLAILARRAADEVADGMILGLGSGSTAEAFVRELGARVRSGLKVRGVATSDRTARLAQELGIPLLPLDDVSAIDLGIDGADEIAPSLDVVKGRGGALLHEKLVALACARYLIVAAAEKLVTLLGTRMPLPVEVVPFGWHLTAARLPALGLDPTLRLTNAQSDDPAPFVSDGGHYVLDCATDPITDPAALARDLKATPGVVDHGLFIGFADRVLVVDAAGEPRIMDREPHRAS